jgi:hypothetical protein
MGSANIEPNDHADDTVFHDAEEALVFASKEPLLSTPSSNRPSF